MLGIGNAHLLPRMRLGGPAFKSGGSQVNKLFKNFVQDESGQDLIEYALLTGFISLVAVVAITNVGTGVNTVYGNIDGQVQAIPSP